jgi:uncharacterized protein DUF6929
MKRIIKKKCYSIILLILIAFSCGKNDSTVLIQVKKLNDYPSASGVEYLNGQLFVIGDDANNLLILDTNFNIKDSISLYSYPEKRIPKNIKPDLEAITSYHDNKGSLIFLFGSGSLQPYRDIGWWYYLETNLKDSMSLKNLYAEIKDTGIEEINIEGACFIPGFLALANRGNKGNPKNHLIFTNEKFWDKKNDYDINTALISQQDDNSSFSGISGLTYAAQNDWLILTVSTEDTRNNLEDGTIGKSYLWIVKNISAKKDQKTIVPDKIIDLEAVSKSFKRHKIESACVASETNNSINLVLVADNDDGSSTIFKMRLAKD